MIPDLVRQAIRIKMTCRSECPLISEAEYCCACALALRELSAPAEYSDAMRQAQRVEDIREKLTPFFDGKRGEYEGEPQMHRLLNLLVHSRVEGEITDEIRELME